MKINPELIESVKNRIILIGVTAPSTADRWKEPPLQRQRWTMANTGVFVQAQMVVIF